MRSGDVRLYPDGSDVCLVAGEVFGACQYGIIPARPSIVIDVGMNVGVSALYFASRPWCEHVFGFEPLPATLDRAARNISLNPSLAAKISTHPFGLGDANYEAQALVDPRNSGITRTFRNSSIRDSANSVAVSIRAVEQELEPLIAVANNRLIHLKMDCEGGEREIFGAMSDGLLLKLSTIMLEWHSRDIVDKIALQLTKIGFTLFINRLDRETGLLYAVRG